MVQVFNDNYSDKYVRATKVYAKATATSGQFEAYEDADKTVAINSAALYEIATKGAIIVMEDGEYFPVAVAAAGVSTPTTITIVVEGTTALEFNTVVAVDPED